MTAADDDAGIDGLRTDAILPEPAGEARGSDRRRAHAQESQYDENHEEEADKAAVLIMGLKELRDNIECVEEQMHHMNLGHPYLNGREMSEMSALEAELNELLDKLWGHEYFYVEATLNEQGFTSYVDRWLWHRSRPHPFLSLDEARATVIRKQETEREAYSKELFSLRIKTHAASKSEASPHE